MLGIGKSKNFICEILQNASPMRQKCVFFIMEFKDNKVLFKYFKTSLYSAKGYSFRFW